ncbi:multidrug effflux MFS transporter [Allorhizobium sp. BGMRC 0089]|uniref:multidrug effflux MFS transporter n=1 Tax=Allorhizobium sonneratiae TaxID=2934936 RepID=UPI0020344AE2|nr:multidrug effflux MFS transporter [Allorhizobium sonneratiae]MCM2292257.1 multidrug effflux MFS transporter [Allorhizobium sonneratiae]
MASPPLPATAARHRLGKLEFVALCALMMALNSLAIDVMLPALGDIGKALHVSDINHSQFIVTSYLIGFGVGQLFYGPISDRFGRRNPLLFGMALYVIAALAITQVPSFAGLLLLRFIHGLGAAATRVITVSIVRDLYNGREMAEVMSLIMMVFMVVPVIAPGTGQLILAFGEWHLIFLFIAFGGLAITLWTYIRLPETLDAVNKREFTASVIVNGFKLVLTNRLSLCYTLACTFIFGSLFGFINSAQAIYVGIYNLGDLFPVAFAAVAIFMSVSAFINSRLVGRIGMRRLSHGALLGFMASTGLWLFAELTMPAPMPFMMFISFFSVTMFLFGWIGANFQALAIEPLGQLAGTASSVQGFILTLGGSLIGAIIGQAFNGTSLPLVLGYFLLSLVGLGFVLLAEKGQLFQPHNPPV